MRPGTSAAACPSVPPGQEEPPRSHPGAVTVCVSGRVHRRGALGGWGSQTRRLHLKSSGLFVCFVNKTSVLVYPFPLQPSLAGQGDFTHFKHKGCVFSLHFFWS